MKALYEKPEVELLNFQINESVMDAGLDYSEGWDEDFG